MEVLSLIMIVTFVCMPSLLTLADFIQFLTSKKRLLGSDISRVLEVFVVVIIPLSYLLAADVGAINGCCGDSTTFSPEHRLTIYFWIGTTVVAYLFSTFRKSLFPPVLEVAINSLLIFGFILNGFVAYQIGLLSVIGNLPIALLFLINLIENQIRVLEAIKNNSYNLELWKNQYAWEILKPDNYLKYPTLILLLLPILFIFTTILMLFGQKPDSIIQAFTQTYHHGFSELDYLCKNVVCGGHYLCSVAANGHKNVVQSHRYGVRHGNLIICNRQLLISNAFEELLSDNFPNIHRTIRRKYDKVGDAVHKYYYLFEHKIISDAVYLLMKPLEWLFLAVLYSFDKRPEDRISMQYLRQEDKAKIKNAIHRG